MKQLRVLRRAAALAGLVMVSAPVTARAQLVYFSDFEQAPDAGCRAPISCAWSATPTDATPFGMRRFLGQFGNGLVTLTLAGLPAHESVTIAFDLYLIRSWDGQGPGMHSPDAWEFSVDGGSPLLRTTFSNFRIRTQSYPDEWDGQEGAGPHAGLSGAAELFTLGYVFNGIPVDSVYALRFTVPHAAQTLVLGFRSLQTDLPDDESWGLDNVLVRLGEPTCADGNVHHGSGVPVLRVDGLTESPTAALGSHEVIVAPGLHAVSLAPAIAGPNPGGYALWVWLGGQPFEAHPIIDYFIDESIGCSVRPTPFHIGQSPQPFRCLRGGLPPGFCAGVRVVRSAPAATPWTRRKPFTPVVLTLHGVVEDAAAAGNRLRLSVTNAVVLRVE